MYQGVYTAIITPFKNGKIDYDSYFKLLDLQIEAKVAGVVPCGTTGESPTLSHEEHKDLIKKTVNHVKKRIQVVAGTGSNSTQEAVELTKSACEDGVDGVLVVNPYYNKPTQDGMIQHFTAIADASQVPLMLYNIPGRTGVNLSPESIFKLSQHPNIQGVKEASGDLGQMAKIISLTLRNTRFKLLSGDDNLLLPVLSIGGTGVVSVVSNLFPKTMVDIVNLWNSGEISLSRELFYKLFPVFQYAFIETNPIPVKTALSWWGLCEPELRLPLTKLSSSPSAEQFKKILEGLKGDQLG
jgi:4-hydroxy-tetrahydrodipicolinate synthase